MDWHKTATDDVLAQLNTTVERGLTQGEAEQRVQKYGLNELVERGMQNPWKILLEQFMSVMVLILIAAAVISLLVGDLKDAVAILAIVVLFGVLGFTQEYRAEKAMAALRKLAVPNVRVRRDGEVREVAASQLVPGDIVLLEAGNVVPADARIVESNNLRIQEAALTGESEPIEKEADTLSGDNLPLGDRRNMGFMGTNVANPIGSAELSWLATVRHASPAKSRACDAGRRERLLANSGLSSAGPRSHATSEPCASSRAVSVSVQLSTSMSRSGITRP